MADHTVSARDYSNWYFFVCGGSFKVNHQLLVVRLESRLGLGTLWLQLSLQAVKVIQCNVCVYIYGLSIISITHSNLMSN